MEAVIPAADGTWYGFYHNERIATICGADASRVTPRIGMARSTDYGANWTDVGIIIEAALQTYECGTANTYFVGGVGDMTALLDADSQFVYVYFSQYGRAPTQQGVAAARLAWADRDAPIGRTDIWSDGTWLPAHEWRRKRGTALVSGTDAAGTRWELPPATAIFSTANGFHDADTEVDAFWGPAIHWNTYLQQYVMLLNRATDEAFSPGGVYVSYSPRLDDPSAWSAPARLLADGAWYPQVVGTEIGSVTDTRAGQSARFFMGGQSNYSIRFTK